VDAATLYWIASDFGGTNTVNAIGLVGLGGSRRPSGREARSRRIQVDDTNVYFTTESGSSGS